MNHLEFENLTGLLVSNTLYSMIEEMYMASGDEIPKGDFCQDYKEHHKSLLLNTFYQRMVSLIEHTEDKEKEIEDLAHFLVDKSIARGDQQMIDRAIAIVGEAGYIQYKIEKKLTFFTFDWDLTIKIINKK